ncbi:hypothetical protein Calab_3238 [Caldithrix abyssi DSM 13497]|uniref:Uncharacterized protein n=1 Tax=Caldithrix abyssi DSM 13497 TaxID=880073 RepID=H1XV09_CALAY|nr:hypothetical protein Calab_3238 [Caldithrix abyssi DSM 13497]
MEGLSQINGCFDYAQQPIFDYSQQLLFNFAQQPYSRSLSAVEGSVAEGSAVKCLP